MRKEGEGRGGKGRRREGRGRGGARSEGARLTGGGTSARHRRAHLLESDDKVQQRERRKKKGGKREGRGENVARRRNSAMSTQCAAMADCTIVVSWRPLIEWIITGTQKQYQLPVSITVMTVCHNISIS